MRDDNEAKEKSGAASLQARESAGTLRDFDSQSVGLGVEGATFQLQSDPERGSSSHHQSCGAAEALGPVPPEVFGFFQVTMLYFQLCKYKKKNER